MVSKIQGKLIIFTRYPAPGTTKTRLIPALGETGAALLHRKLTLRTVEIARHIQKNHSISIEVCFEGSDLSTMQNWLGFDLLFTQQSAGDIGRRMINAFAAAFEDGTTKAVLVGTDCPELSAHDIVASFRSLNGNDIVLGPSIDGGFYLIGLTAQSFHDAFPALFEGIRWSTAKVMSLLQISINRYGLSCDTVSTLHDIDYPEDLSVLNTISPKISIIIPVRNESAHLEATLERITSGFNVETIVVDANSSDNSAEIAHAYGVSVISCESSRARQMNAGARVASGEILLFLHADTVLPEGFDDSIRLLYSESTCVGGAFELKIDSRIRGLRVIERLANWRSRTLHMPYGDQGIFVRADVFNKSGGFPEMPIMEDFEFMKRLSRNGEIDILDKPVTTSGRRWEQVGFWKTTLLNQVIIAAYFIGVSPARLSAWYHGKNDMSRKP